MGLEELFRLCRVLELKGRDAIEFVERERTLEREREERTLEREREREREKALERQKERAHKIRIMEIRLGITSKFNKNVEGLHSGKNKSADRVRKLEEENELKIELADPKQKKAVLPSISGSELSRQIISSRESPMKGENSFSQPEISTEREVTSSRDISIPSAFPKQEKNEDEVSSSSSEIEHSGTSIPKCETVDTRRTEEGGCYDEITISSGKELPVERPRIALTDNMDEINTFVPSELGLENTPVEGEKNKVAEKHCWKPDVQVKLEEESMLEEGEVSDNSVTSSDNNKQMKELVVIKSEVENSSQDGASIIKRRKLGTIQSKNPISMLNEFYPELKYKVINQLGPSHEPTFTVGLKLNDHHFEISIRNKKNEKYMTAEWTLRYLVQLRNENEMVQALKSNCPKRVEFTEDSSASNISSSSEFKESVQGASFNKQGKDISEGGKERKTVSSQNTENLIVPFNHFGKSAKYGMLEKSNDSYSKTFKFSNIAGQQCFEETGSKMLLFKTVAAKEALSKLSDLVITPFVHLHYVSLTSHPNLHRPQNLADRIAKSVCEKFLSLTSEKSNLARKKNRIRKMRLYKYRRKEKFRRRK